MDEEKIDYVNHPPHYQSKKGMEVIDVIEAFTEGLEGVEATDTGNIIKYICRWKKKNGRNCLYNTAPKQSQINCANRCSSFDRSSKLHQKRVHLM